MSLPSVLSKVARPCILWVPVVGVTLVGCQQSMSYINIPADQKDVAMNSPNGGSVPTIEAASLKAIAKEFKVKAPATLLLPPGTTYDTYKQVVARAGDVFVMPEIAPADAPVYEVRALRVRGGEAQVDIVTKGEIRPLELTEVHLEYKVNIDGMGWRAETVEGRRVLPKPAEHQAPKPPPVIEEAPPKAADAAKESAAQEPVKEPLAEAAKEPVREPAKESAKEPVKEPVKESVKEAATEPAQAPVQEAPVKQDSKAPIRPEAQ